VLPSSISIYHHILPYVRVPTYTSTSYHIHVYTPINVCAPLKSFNFSSVMPAAKSIVFVNRLRNKFTPSCS